MNTPQISVILPAYNAEKYVGEAVDSILTQTFTDFELIVIDDGSTDRTLEIARGYSDMRVAVFANDENLGIAKTRNIGIAKARGRYIACQDADDISLPKRLGKQYRYLEKHPQVALLGTGRRTMLSGGKIKRQRLKPSSPTFNDMLRSNRFVHGSIMIRGTALEKIGGYNEFFYLSSDYELCLRLAKQFPVANLSEPLYILRRHSGRSTWKSINLSVLYRLLARDMALGKIRGEELARIYNEGIEFYYSRLSKKNKIRYHQRVAKKCMNCGYNAEALNHYRQLTKFQGTSFKVAGNILRIQSRLFVNRVLR